MNIDNITVLVDDYFNGQYTVEKFLGEGSFAQVYLLKHNYLNDRRAMKIIKEPLDPSTNVDNVFYEVMIATRLRGENIISIYDAGKITTYGFDDDGYFILDDENTGIIQKWAYFLIEYVPGGDLEDYRQSFINSDIQMPIFQVLELIRQILMGLDILHSSKPQIIHRDIKTSNILLRYDAGSNPQAKISDFGFAKEVTSDITISDFGGTKAYMAPEAFNMTSTTMTDVYAVGVIFYLLLTNHYPVDVSDVSLEQLQDENFWKANIKKPSQYNSNIPSILDNMILKSLSVNPSDRYKDAKEFLDQLNNVISQLKDSNNEYFDQSLFQSTSQYNQYGKLPINDNIIRAFQLAETPGRLNDAKEILEKQIIHDYNTRLNYSQIYKLWNSTKAEQQLINEAFTITLRAENYKLARTFIKEAIAIDSQMDERYGHYLTIWKILNNLDADENLIEAVDNLEEATNKDSRINEIYKNVMEILRTYSTDEMLNEALKMVEEDNLSDAALLMELVLLKNKKYKPKYAYKLSLWKQEMDM